jgi:hypothetical protein
MRRLQALSSDRYVIGIDCGEFVRKLFQIIPAKDGSLYVSFPYTPFTVGRVGFLTLGANSQHGVIFGDDAPVTWEKVKYSHHPSGAVHFSQSGRVRTDIRKSGVPFGKISGHIFTITAQGIDRYKEFPKNAKKKRGSIVVAFSPPVQPAGAYKFVAHVYSERELAGRCVGSGSGLWIRCVSPSGKLLWGIMLATKFQSEHGRKFIWLVLEPVPKMCAEYEELLIFLGGFDPPEISLNPSGDTRAVMLLYPEKDCTDELLRRVGTIDLPKHK